MMRDKQEHLPDAAAAGGIPEAAGAPGSAAPPGTGGAMVEPPAEAITRLEAEVGEARAQLAQAVDKYLRLAADFENFKKRVVRERMELRTHAQVELLQRLVDALDDLARFAHVDPAETTAKTIHDGVDMVERKVWKALDALGVTRVDQVGVPFDPNQHEAVTMQPAAHPAQDHTVGAVLQAGYKLGDALIRPARVVVLAWQGEAASPSPPSTDNRPMAGS